MEVVCDNCIHRNKYFDEYIGWCVWCIPRKAYILPDPLSNWEIEEVISKGECEYKDKEIYFDEDGFARIKQNEGNSLNLGIYD